MFFFLHRIHLAFGISSLSLHSTSFIVRRQFFFSHIETLIEPAVNCYLLQLKYFSFKIVNINVDLLDLCVFFSHEYGFCLQMMCVLIVLVTMLASTALSIRVDFNTNTGPIRPPTTTPSPPPPRPPFREPAPVWEDQSNDIPNPNPFRYNKNHFYHVNTI